MKAMRWLLDQHPEAIRQLSNRRKYSRAYIATDPGVLYGNRSDLTRFARQFAPDWHVDTNLSYDNTKRFLADAFAQAGLLRGRDWYFSRLD